MNTITNQPSLLVIVYHFCTTSNATITKLEIVANNLMPIKICQGYIEFKLIERETISNLFLNLSHTKMPKLAILYISENTGI